MHTKTTTILESTESSSVALEGIPNEKKGKKNMRLTCQSS